jgi:regulator of protease activity HflC (stomatin/prohibitin superfamily)
MEDKIKFLDMTDVQQAKYIIKVIGFVLIGLLIIMTILKSFTTIGAGQRGVVLRLGAVNGIMTEGLNFKVPFIDKVAVLDVKTQKEEVGATSASKDLQTVSAQIALNYHLSPDEVSNLWQSVGDEYKMRIIDPAIQEAVKSSTAKFTAEELITKRPAVKEEIKASLKERLAKEFIIVDEVSIVNFDFSKSFNEAIEAKVTAEQNALASKNKLEQIKYEAEQRIATATAEAEAIRIQAQAIQNQGGAEYVNLKAIEKWNGILPTTMLPSQTLPFINVQ